MLMSTIKKTSFPMSNDQKNIIVKLLRDYFTNHLQNGNGSYLATLDLENMIFNWCNNFLFTNDACIYGAWNPKYKNEIFIQPGFYKEEARQKYNEIFQNKSDDEIQIENSMLFTMYKNYVGDFNLYNKYQTDLNKKVFALPLLKYTQNLELYCFLNDLLNNSNSSKMTTILHELYHKWQYNASPILYMINFFVGNLLTYNLSSKLDMFIQGDVRKYVDNESTEQLIYKFSKVFQILFRISEETQQNQTAKLNSIKTDINEVNIEFNLIIQICKEFKILKAEFIQMIQKKYL